MSETLTIPVKMELTDSDQRWLVSFGVDPSWQNDPNDRDQINNFIELGSRRLDEPNNQADRALIVDARLKFMDFIGIAQTTIDAFQDSHPTIIPIDTFIDTQRTFFDLDLDAVKVINVLPAAISYAPESVREKVANLEALGLDAVKVINALPAAISYAPESVREKVRFLNRSIGVLKWEHTAVELINYYPALLGYNTERLAILRRIAAKHIKEASRSAEPKQVSSALILPLEKYILELSQDQDNIGKLPEQTTLQELEKRVRKHNLNQKERREQALAVAKLGSGLGKIATMYLSYRA